MRRFLLLLPFLILAIPCHGQRFVRYFDTVAQMAASNPNDPHLYVVVGGGTAFNDSGSAQWKWVAGETVANGDDRIASTWVNPPVGLWIRINEAGVVFPGGSTNYSVIVVPTISDLKNVSVASGIQAVQVESYNNRGDGGGGDFLYRSSSTEVEDGMINIAPNNGIGGDMWERAITDNSLGVRPPWAGGFTTNGTIQRAIDYAADNDKVRTVVIPSGTHILNCQTGIIMRSNVRLIGDPGAVLQTEANPPVSYCTITFEPGATNWAIQNLVFDGWPSAPGSASNTGRAIFLSGASNGIIAGCTFTNFWSESIKIGTNDWSNVEIADSSGVRNSILAFGATRDYGDDDTAALAEAIAYTKRSGYQLVLPGGDYRATNTFDVTGCSLDGFGLATIWDARLATGQTGDSNRTTISGLNFKYYNWPNFNEVISANGDRTVIENCLFQYNPPVTNVVDVNSVTNRDQIAWTAVEVSGNSEGVRILNTVSDMPLRAGFIVNSAKDVKILGCYVHSIDDGVAGKATTGPLEGLEIGNCRFTNSATVLGLGTELKFPVHGILVHDIIAENVAGALLIKPGSGSDRTNQLVEGITFDSINIYDTNGVRFQYAGSLQVYAGMRVKDVTYRNITVVARAATNNIPRDFFFLTGSKTPQIVSPGTVYTPPFIDGIVLENIRCSVPTNTGGYGLEFGVEMWAQEELTMTNITIRNCIFENLENKAIYGRIFTSTNLPVGILDDITIDGVTSKNGNTVATNSPAIQIDGNSKVSFRNVDIDPVPSSIGFIPALVVTTNSVIRAAATMGSGGDIPTLLTTLSLPMWKAPENCWVHTVKLADYYGVTQDDTNYVTFSIRNRDSGQILATNNTTLAGLNLAAGGDLVEITTTNAYEASYFPYNDVMVMDITQVGIGQRLKYLVWEIEFVPFSGGVSSGGGLHNQTVRFADNNFTVQTAGSMALLNLNNTSSLESRLAFQEDGTNRAVVTWEPSANRLVAQASKTGSHFVLAAPTSVELWGGNVKRWEFNSSGHIIPNGSNLFNVGSILFPAAELFGNKIYPNNAAAAFISGGAGSPEGVVPAAVGSLWIRTDGGAGTTLYKKESGAAGSTGWVADSGGGGLASTDIDTSAELNTIVTDNTGTGPLVFSGGATLTDTTLSESLNRTSVDLGVGTSIDPSLGNVFTKTLSANTVFTFANLADGQHWLVIVTNGASWTATWPLAATDWISTNIPVMDVGAGAVNVFSFVRTGGRTLGDYSQQADPSILRNASIDTSAEIAAIVGNETGSGLLVFGTSPTIVTPTIASMVNATHDHQDAAGGGLLAEAALNLTDLTTGDVSTTAHGFVPKAPNSATKFLNGLGQWADGTAAAQATWSVTQNGGGQSLTNIYDLVGSGTNSTLDNQTMTGDGSIVTRLTGDERFLRKPNIRRQAWWMSDGNVVAGTRMGDSLSATGTASVQAATATEGSVVNYASAASAASDAGASGGTIYRTGRNINLISGVKLQENTQERCFIGITDRTLATMGNSDSPTSGNYAGFLYTTNATGSYSAVNWNCVTKDGTTLNIVASGVAVDTAFHHFEVEFNDSVPSVAFKIDGVTVATSTSNLPTSGVNSRYVICVETTEAVAKNIRIAYTFVGSDL